MTYIDYRNAIREQLHRPVAGMTWAQLQRRLRLPYDRPCPAWTARLESDIGLVRGKGKGRALVWKLRCTGEGNP
jgi:hypothetical protein